MTYLAYWTLRKKKNYREFNPNIKFKANFNHRRQPTSILTSTGFRFVLFI